MSDAARTDLRRLVGATVRDAERRSAAPDSQPDETPGAWSGRTAGRGPAAAPRSRRSSSGQMAAGRKMPALRPVNRSNASCSFKRFQEKCDAVFRFENAKSKGI